MKRPWFVAIAGLLALAAAAVVLWPSTPAKAQDHRAQRQADTAGGSSVELNDTGIPTLITDLASWQGNGEGGRYYAPIIAGATPGQATLGTVRTDTDCAPDAEGLSHCHNVIELLSGGTITIQDNHNMMVNRCLGPGEEVTVTPIAPGWVKLHTRPS